MPAIRQSPNAGTGQYLSKVDHLVYAAPDFYACVKDVEGRFGVKAEPLGQHPGFGTRNALIALGDRSFLEIIGPDPEQPDPGGPRLFGIDELEEARLVTWVVSSDDLAGVVEQASSNGLDLGGAFEAGRRKPDGSLVSWRLTSPYADRAGGVIPFFIDWGDSPNPAAEYTTACSLMDLRGRHPDAEAVGTTLAALGLDLVVTDGPEPRLAATLDTPRGEITVS